VGSLLSRAALVAALFLCTLLTACGDHRPAQTTPRDDPDRAAERPAFTGEAEREGEEEGEGEEAEGGPAAEEVAARAFPRQTLSAAQAIAAERDFRELATSQELRAASGPSLPTVWRWLGPDAMTKPARQTYPSPDILSGRVTALAVDPGCDTARCRVWLAAAGGGIWRTTDGLAEHPTWTYASSGITSNAIGAIAIDPNDPDSDTLYAGTGEANVSSDAEAGVGLFRSTDGGDSWSVVPGSVAVGRDRSIGAIAIPDGEPDTIYIGTSRGRHGRAGFGGSSDYTPPNAPAMGVYRSADGGAHFDALLLPAGTGDPADATDAPQGGVSSLVVQPGDPDTLYATVYGHGVYRVSPSLDGDDDWHLVFTPSQLSDSTRVEMDAVRVDADTVRLYVVEGVDGGQLWRSDDGGEDAATLAGSWTEMTSSDVADPGFGGYGICGGQCSYDLAVRAQSDDADVVWIGGVAQWDEIPPMSSETDRAGASYGRTVVRSTDGGTTWNDMTVGADDPPVDFGGSIGDVPMNGAHPDLHFITLVPSAPDAAFVAGDGGLVRTSAALRDATDDCDDRELDADNVARCEEWLSAVPAHVADLNRGLGTLQLHRISVAPDGSGELLGGAQDNGSMARGADGAWRGFAQGDGGGNGFDAADPNVRWHTYYSASVAVNVDYDADPLGGWIDVGGGTLGDASGSCVENCAFYPPFLADPRVGSRAHQGQQHVWRTLDRGGSWAPMGEDLTAAGAGDRAGGYVSALGRSVADTATMWAATSGGRVWVTRNSDAADAADVAWLRVDGAPLPQRYPTAIAVDPTDPLHAFISYTGYAAYTPGQPGHVFEARLDPDSGTATFTDITADLGDVPVLDIAYDPVTADVWLATDWGVARRAGGDTSWKDAADGMPLVAVYGLAMDPVGRTITAATHGRGAYQIALPGPPFVPPAPVTPATTPAAPAETPLEPTRPETTSVPTTPAAPPSRRPVIALAGRGSRVPVSARGGLVVRLRPFAQAVRGRAELLVKRGGRRGSSRLAQRTFRAGAGNRVALHLRLNREGRRLLRGRRHVGVVLRITVRTAGGTTTTRRLRITLRAS
jgi:hypothetical protein